MPKTFFNIRVKAILSVMAIIILLSSVFLLLSIRQQKDSLAQRIEEKRATAQFVAKNIQEHSFAPYKKRIVSLATTKKKVIAAFAKRDRQALQKAVTLFYNTIKAENKFFFIMHFCLPDGTSFLRMHLPHVYGDDISKIRPMVMQVHDDKKQVSGFEVGRKGLFYRVVQPVFFQGKYIGSLEFGLRFEQLLEYLKKNVSQDVAIAIKKTSWQKADLVVAEKIESNDYFLLPMGRDIFKDIGENVLAENGVKQVQVGWKTYTILSDIVLKSHDQQPIAKVVVALDISNEIHSANRFIRDIVFLTLILLCIAGLVLYFSFGKLLTKIFNLNESLASSNMQLSKSKSYVESIISSMSDGLLVTSSDGRISQANQALGQLMGCPIEEVLNKRLHDLFQQADQVKDLFDKSKDNSEPVKSEQLLRAAEGRTIPVILSITNLGRGEHVFDRQVCIVADITDRKEAERVLQQSHDELEHRVAERTRELAESNQALHMEMKERMRVEEDLRQAQKMEAIGTLAGGIAHDFNNILTSILGYVDLSRYSTDKTEITSFLDEVFKAGLRAKDLVQQILTFSRQSEQEKTPIFLHSVIKESLKLLRASIPTNIEISQEIDTECGMVMADPTQIHQIMMNLCTNAYHAIENSGGGLAVSLCEVTVKEDVPGLLPGPYLQLQVCDSGPGMPQETMERIFEPYFTTKKDGKGTGLGLSVVHGIVESHDGKITVQSTPGEGTCFTILLPCCDEQAESLESSPPAIDLPAGGDEHLLVVDDEEEITRLQHHILTQFGYRVTRMTDSSEALDWFVANHDSVDLVMTDMSMPKITGLSLAQKMLKLRPDIPVILCTGFSNGTNEEQAKVLGLSAFLHKPIDRKILAQTVRNVLDHKHSWS